MGLRDAFRDPARQGEFGERLKPLRRLMIGDIPAGILSQGMLPTDGPRRELPTVSREDLAQP